MTDSERQNHLMVHRERSLTEGYNHRDTRLNDLKRFERVTKTRTPEYLRAFFADWLQDHEQIRVADLGAGKGSFARMLRRWYRRDFDTDQLALHSVSLADMREEPQQRMDDKLQIEYAAEEVNDWLQQQADNSLTFVYTCFLWEHLIDPLETLELLYRKMAPGGRIWLQWSVPDNFFVRLDDFPKCMKHLAGMTGTEIKSEKNGSVEVRMVFELPRQKKPFSWGNFVYKVSFLQNSHWRRLGPPSQVIQTQYTVHDENTF